MLHRLGRIVAQGDQVELNPPSIRLTAVEAGRRVATLVRIDVLGGERR
jgi:hypothetical protein